MVYGEIVGSKDVLKQFFVDITSILGGDKRRFWASIQVMCVWICMVMCVWIFC